MTQPPYGQYQRHPGDPVYPMYPSGGALPYPPPPAGTSGFAIASLIFGIFGGVLLSVIFGIAALSQINRRGQRGRGMAIAGLTLSGVWVVGIAIAVTVAVINAPDPAKRDPAGSVAQGGRVSVEDLRVGDCFNGLKDGRIFSVDAVPCIDPHEAEVFAVFTLPDAKTYPGDDTVLKLSEEACNNRLPDYSEKAVDDDTLELFVYHPSSSSWSRGDREATCIVGSASQKRSGSVRD